MFRSISTSAVNYAVIKEKKRNNNYYMPHVDEIHLTICMETNCGI